MSELPDPKLVKDRSLLRVFGYASLLWNPGFACKSKVVGYVDGYIRRFSQGDQTFRGKPGRLGRVANLERMPGRKTWGVAYEVRGEPEFCKVWQYLHKRESSCGRYIPVITNFYPREYSADVETKVDHDAHHSLCNESNPLLVASTEFFGEDNECSETFTSNGNGGTGNGNGVTSNGNSATSTGKGVTSNGNGATSNGNGATSNENGVTGNGNGVTPFEVLMYIATTDNDLYLGEDTMDNIAHQVVNSSGEAGENSTYVLNVADYIRTYIPEDDDEYLFELEAKIREEMKCSTLLSQ